MKTNGKSNDELIKLMEHGISEIGGQDPGSRSQLDCFKCKMKDLKKLWEQEKITWDQLYSLYQQAQEGMNYKWQDVEIEDILS
jgi:hypothetical protein